MKKTLKIFLTVICMAPVAGACVNLDETVYSDVTEANFDYGTNIGTAMGMVYKDLKVIADYTKNFSLQECSADIIVMPANNDGWYNGGEYQRAHLHTWTSAEIQLEKFWDEFYAGPIKCNTALDLLNSDRLKASEEEIEYAKYEVRAVRAFYYWYLTDMFGAIPLVTSTSEEEALPSKTSRPDVCSWLERELTEIIPHLTEETGNAQYGRMNQWAARALLATIYLNWEVYTGTPRWEDCITQCDAIITSRKYDLERFYKDCFKAYGMETSPEIIFTIPYQYEYTAWGNRLHCASWHNVCKDVFSLTDGPYGQGSICAVPQFIDTYDEDDTRLQDTWLMGKMNLPNGQPALIQSGANKGKQLEFYKELKDGLYVGKEGEGYRMKKFEVAKGSYAQSDTDYPLFRYADVLMMKAECLLRLGRSGAGDLVTQVRERAFRETDPAKASVTDAELKENTCYEYGYVENYQIVDRGDQTPVEFGRMYDELGWEFAWECHRRRDAIRFGTFTTKSWLSHKPNGDYRIVFPLPEDRLAANPNLEQNPDYLETICE